MWNITWKSVPVERFLSFTPVDVLYEFDGPRIFSVMDADGELNLAYWSDEEEAVCRHVVVPTTVTILEALKSGSISVYDALNQPRCWLCDVNDRGEILECRRVEFDAIPRDALPVAGTLLLPS